MTQPIADHLAGRRVLVTGASGFIGTNLIELLLAVGAEVKNLDVHPPNLESRAGLWTACDIMDPVRLEPAIASFDPHAVVHLAARADSDGDDLEGYRVNFDGTRNVVDALRSAESVERLLLVSTQFVLGPDHLFEHELQYAPHTVYGQSKVIAEQYLREDDPDLVWSILRPTNVWGPWHRRYQAQFWRVLRRGLYLHPRSPDPVRSFGYVGSVCLQILQALRIEPASIHRRALYVGDRPIPQSEWVDEFSHSLRGRSARRVPKSLLSGLARIGDQAQRARLPSPITTSRLASMTSEYLTPMEQTAKALGTLSSVPLSVGVEETVQWLKDDMPPSAEGWLDWL